MRAMYRLVMLALFVGCAPATYAWTPSSGLPVNPKPDNCAFEVVTGQPPESEEIGTLVHYNGTPPKDANKFKEAVAKQVCGAGGDAVIATTNDKGELVKGSVVRYPKKAPEPTPPQAPATP